MRALPLLLPVLLFGTPAGLASQWHAGVEIAAESLTGVSANREPGGPVFRFENLTGLGLRLESPGSRIRWSLIAGMAFPSLALQGPEVTIIDRQSRVTVGSLRPGVTVPLITLRPGVSLRVEGRPVLEWWHFDTGETRLRGGAEAGASLEIVLAGRLSLATGGFLGVLPESPLEASDLPEGIEPRSAWRRALRGSLQVAW